jgi:Fur family ferric uptake transcriptional regulator
MTGDHPAARVALDEVRLIGRRTTQRATVIAALIAVADFTSAQALHAQLTASGEQVGLSTVYRTLTRLSRAGRADLIGNPGGALLFRYRPRQSVQHHLMCRHCGSRLPIDASSVETWAARITSTLAYAEVRHTVEVTGICPACQIVSRANEAS